MICISGPSSCGKTSILKALKDKGYHVCQKQYARELLEKRKWTIADVWKSKDRLFNFHIELIETKFNTEFKESYDFAERSPIDIFIYFLMYFEVYYQVRPDLLKSEKNLSAEEIQIYTVLKKAIGFHHFLYQSMIHLESIPHLDNDGIRIVDIDWIKRQQFLFKVLLDRIPNVVTITDFDFHDRLHQCENVYAILQN